MYLWCRTLPMFYTLLHPHHRIMGLMIWIDRSIHVASSPRVSRSCLTKSEVLPAIFSSYSLFIKRHRLAVAWKRSYAAVFMSISACAADFASSARLW